MTLIIFSTKMKNILLLQWSGFIGSCLIKYLLKISIKEKIISLDNYSSGYVKIMLKIARLNILNLIIKI